MSKYKPVTNCQSKTEKTYSKNHFHGIMVDDKVEMNNEAEDYSSANTNDPKNVQELTQYVKKSLLCNCNIT